MGTITDKLNKLSSTKAAIRTAITDKGQAVADGDTFASYAGKVLNIEDTRLVSLLNQRETITTVDASYDSVMSKLANGRYMFYESSKLNSFSANLNTLTNGVYMFKNCFSLTTVTSNLGALVAGNQMFEGCILLTTFTSNLGALANGNQMFGGCMSLTTFTSNLSSLTTGVGMFGMSSKLTVDSLLNIINTIPNRTGQVAPTLTLGTTNLGKLTAAQKAIATNKNWILA